MSEHQDMVREFHLLNEIEDPPSPTLDGVPLKLRCDLILEEAIEFCSAAGCEATARPGAGPVAFPSVDHVPDLVACVDAICDLLYVVHGAALALGVDIDPLMAEVHRSNLSKLGENGRPIRRGDGKILKGPNYSPPNLGPLLMAQGWSSE